LTGAPTVLLFLGCPSGQRVEKVTLDARRVLRKKSDTSYLFSGASCGLEAFFVGGRERLGL
jgi:hypothetical protein